MSLSKGVGGDPGLRWRVCSSRVAWTHHSLKQQGGGLCGFHVLRRMYKIVLLESQRVN